MKIAIFSDVHWSERSSITNKFGIKYTQRLEMLIKSINWVNETAIKEDCEIMICAGDMMDKSTCSDMELTALREIKWNNLDCYFICGNHESSVSDLRFSSLKAIEDYKAKRYVTSDQCWSMKAGKTQIHFVPYIVESDRRELEYYLDKEDDCDKHIVISHNDIAGINYGPIVSKLGFSIDDIEDCCDLYLNGHLHNSEWITKKILNVGSLSAHNFTNDSSKYSYGMWILDTETLSLKFIENPYAFNFYKVEINKKEDLKVFNNLKENSVISIKCNNKFVDEIKSIIATNKNIIETRLIITKDIITDLTEPDMSNFSVDYIAKFIECARERYGTDEILEAELAEVCK